MAPKKSQKMSIGDFLSDQSLGSWADEMDTQPMPSPSGLGSERRNYGSTSSGFGGDSRGGDRFGGDRGGYQDRARPMREQLPLPDKPPFTAHLGNLSFEVTENDVQNLLTGCDVTSVRIVEDKLDRKPKGFGYVEFSSLDGLKKALEINDVQFQGRQIRISVAEPPKERAENREFNDWTRKGPLPDIAGQGTMRRGSERTGGFRNADPALDVNNERPSRRAGPPAEMDGKIRDFGNWERKGPLSPSLPAEGRNSVRGSKDFGSTRERRQSPAWGEGRSGEESRDSSERPPPPERVPTAAGLDNQWRAKMKPDTASPPPAASEDTASTSIPSLPSKVAERPRLNLAKRTISETPNPDSGSAASTDAKASPFGAARPADTAAREREVEEKRQIAIKEKKEADDKAREEKKAKAASASASSASSPPGEGVPKDSGAPIPRDNNSSRKQSKDDGAAAHNASSRQYEILRRAKDDGEETASEAGTDAAVPEISSETDHDAPNADMNGQIPMDKEVKPKQVQVVRESSSGGKDGWRKQSSNNSRQGSTRGTSNSGTGANTPTASSPAGQSPITSSVSELDADGFTVVSAGRKSKSARGGAPARALAS